MYVETTPNGELKRRVEAACKKNEMKIKIVEKIGNAMKKELQRSNPFGQQHCTRTDCVTCNLGLQINCRKRGQVNELWCKNCEEDVKKKYQGQTGRTLYNRIKEHFNKWESKNEDSILHKHLRKVP